MITKVTDKAGIRDDTETGDVSEVLKRPLTERFDAGMATASRLHRLQARKGTNIAYLSHLLAVAATALENGATEDEAIAALLHDAIEDQGGASTERAIREQFGDEVAAIVRGCTDTDVEPKPPWRLRKEDYITHIRRASPSVRLVSACDKLHNARSILDDYRHLGDAVWSRFRGGKDGTLWYYRALVTAFQEAGSSRLVEELDRTVGELERLVYKSS
jgi:(p)ppGpp synthase/HD superfamily hydrolase